MASGPLKKEENSNVSSKQVHTISTPIVHMLVRIIYIIKTIIVYLIINAQRMGLNIPLRVARNSIVENSFITIFEFFTLNQYHSYNY